MNTMTMGTVRLRGFLYVHMPLCHASIGHADGSAMRTNVTTSSSTPRSRQRAVCRRQDALGSVGWSNQIYVSSGRLWSSKIARTKPPKCDLEDKKHRGSV
ncbi:hypothetical protein RRG08_001632 [Elysia crispata]|uniref:Uncharacterized protein n=1 Tax=Elysia crispata TaxID=231223 RepID=A0AAE1E081_9GAST|nr:hypothetical protein RRG08_001632 [Elysia crispata]